jgi:hypothetical protein
VLAERVDTVNVAANSVVTLAPLALATALEHEGLVLVVLKLSDASGATLSENIYWQGRDSASQRRLNELAPQPVTLGAEAHDEAGDTIVDVRLANGGRAAALAAKITLLDGGGRRVLPVYYGDNYLTLLPGESRHVLVRCPHAGSRCAQVALRGWNIEPRTTKVISGRGN